MNVEMDSIELQVQSSAKDAVNELKEMESALKRIRDLTKSGFGFNATSKQIKDIEATSKSISKLSKTIKGLAFNAFSLPKIRNALSGWVQSANDYVENVNLFQVSMGEFYDEAFEYANLVENKLSIDSSEWMRNQGIFMSMANGFGLAKDQAYELSEGLTELAYDLSSLYNEDIDSATKRLQSALAGEIEPIRRLGISVSQATLQEYALSKGINESVSSMTEQEKALLRSLKIMEDSAKIGAVGDFVKTLESPANAIRILKQQIQQLGRALGSVFIPILIKVIPYVQAFVSILTDAVRALATLVGFQMPEWDNKDWNNAMGDSAGAVDGVTESVDKLKNATLGIDELNVINQDSGAGGIGAMSDWANQLEVPNLWDEEEIARLKTEADEIKKRLEGIRDTVFEWLGLTGEITSWSDLMDTRLGSILTTVGLIGAGIALWKVTTGFLDSILLLSSLLSNPSFVISVGVVLTFAGLTGLALSIKDAVQNGLDKFNFGGILASSLLTTGGLATLGSKLVTWIGKIGSTKVAFALAEMGKNLGVATTGALGAALGAGISGIIVGIPTMIVGIYDAIKNGIDWLSGILIPVGTTAAATGIGTIIGTAVGSVGGPLGAGIGALVGVIVGALTDLVIFVVQKWDVIVSWWDTTVKPWFSGIVSFVHTYVVEPIVTFFSGAVERIAKFFEGCWIIVQAIWMVAKEAFRTNITEPIAELFYNLKEKISEGMEKAWENIQETLRPAVEWVDENMVAPLKELYEKATQKIGEFFTGLWDGIKTGAINAMNFVIDKVESVINGAIGKVNGFLSSFNGIVETAADFIGADWDGVKLIQELNLPRITAYAAGGYPTSGELFIAREAGPELVGAIGSRTAVANNDQIVSGIQHGVEEGNMGVVAALYQAISVLERIEQKETVVELDGDEIAQKTTRTRNGYSLGLTT